MPMRRARASHHRGSTRRRTSWARQNGTISIAAVNQETTVDLLTGWKAAGGSQTGVTIGRLHLRLTPINAVAADVGNNLFVGVMRGQSNDVGANIAGAPNPSVDLNEDYYLWDQLTADITGGFWPGGGVNAVYDLRSMRKLPQLEETFNLVLASTGWHAFPLSVRYTASTLVLLA